MIYPAGRYDLTIQQGATFTLPLHFRDANDQPIDLTNTTVRFQVRNTTSSAATLVDLINDSGATVTPLTGSVLLSIAASATLLLPPGSAVYDLTLEQGAVVTRVLEGKVQITPTVTR